MNQLKNFSRRLQPEVFDMVRGISLAFAALALAALGASSVLAQYPPPGGYGGSLWGSPQTAASASMNGMANMMSAKGSYNLQTSQAAINMTQAQSQEIANHQQYTDTYFQMRATNQAATEKERGPHPSAEQLARIAADGVPKPISPGDSDPVTGQVAWPDVLMDDEFADGRKEVEGLLGKKAANGRLGFQDQQQATKAIDGMFDTLKSQISDIPPARYMESKDFLRSLIYSISKTDLS